MSAAQAYRRSIPEAVWTRARPDPALLSDEQLLARYRDTRVEALFNELVRRYSAELGRRIGRLLHDRELAADVLQATWLHVHDRRALYQDGRRVRPWLHAIAGNLAVDALRHDGRHPWLSLDRPAPSIPSDRDGWAMADVLADDRPEPLDTLFENERAAWLRERLDQLPDRLRKTLDQAYDQDLTLAEIADREGVPLGTIKSRLHDALDRLRAEARRSHLGNEPD